MASTAIEERRSIVGRSAYQPLVVVLAAAAAGIVLDRVSVVPLAGWLALAWAAGASGPVCGDGKTAGRPGCCSSRLPGRPVLGTTFGGIGSTATIWACLPPSGPSLEGRALGSPRRIPPPPFDPMRTLRAGDEPPGLGSAADSRWISWPRVGAHDAAGGRRAAEYCTRTAGKNLRPIQLSTSRAKSWRVRFCQARAGRPAALPGPRGHSRVRQLGGRLIGSEHPWPYRSPQNSRTSAARTASQPTAVAPGRGNVPGRARRTG